MQRDHAVVDEDVGGVALAVREDVAQVAHVAIGRAGVAMVFLEDRLCPFTAIPGIISKCFFPRPAVRSISPHFCHLICAKFQNEGVRVSEFHSCHLL